VAFSAPPIDRLLAHPREHRLAYRLLAAIVLASTCLALLATGVQLFIDYKRDLAAIQDGLDRIERSQLASLSNSLWSFDETQLQLQLNGLLQLPDVKYAAVRAKGGERYAAGTLPASDTMTRQFTLRHGAGEHPAIGVLSVSIGLDGVYRRLVDKAIAILAATIAGTFLISLFILLLVGRWVTRHLEHMARHARSLNLEQLGEPLRLARRPGARPDELDQVAAALNDMTGALAEELNRRAAINAERARLFAAYERNRGMLQAIIDHSPAAVSVKALDGRYLLANRRCAELHHKDVAAFVGKTDHELFPPELAAALRNFDQRVIEARCPMQEEEAIPLDDGTHTMLSAKAPLYNDKGELYAVCGIHTDITERKHAEQELQHYREHLEILVEQRTAELQRANDDLVLINLRLEQAQMQLVQSEKMASIGVLAAGVAHEINNPIGYVSANLRTLGEYVADLLKLVAAYEQAEDAIASAAPHQLSAIARSKREIGLDDLRGDVAELGRETAEGLARVTKIVQDLKDFSHTGECRWQYADLHKGIDSTLNIAWNELKHKVEVVKQYGALPEIECLPSELNQVFMSLFVNAAQAIKARGVIRIETGADIDGVWVEVADSGSGIAPEHLQRIFEPFFSTKPVGQGTGLGLSLSYATVKKHHGRLDVRSTVGEGTTFRVWLPLTQQVEAALA
jgi:PAS domain S-box-containing protein